jgi:hypothetical protein
MEKEAVRNSIPFNGPTPATAKQKTRILAREISLRHSVIFPIQGQSGPILA